MAGAPGLVAHPAPHRPGGLAWWSTRPNNSPPNPWTGSRLWNPIRPGGERCAREGIDLTGEGPEPPTGDGGRFVLVEWLMTLAGGQGAALSWRGTRGVVRRGGGLYRPLHDPRFRRSN